jgi:cytochrome c-type biogenesis protein
VDDIFTTLTHAIDGAPAIALAAALLWGVLSVVLSPCHLAGIPLIVGFIAGEPDVRPRRAFALSSAFALGMLLCIAVIGVITAALGRMAGDLGKFTTYFVIGMLFLAGLVLLDVIPLPFSGPGQIGMKLRGMPGAFLLGLFFGIALGPCTFAFMVPVIVTAFQAGASAPLFAAGLLLIYGVGHCGVIAAAGASIDTVQRYLHWNESTKTPGLIKKICGVLVLLGGLSLLWKT